jgi:hypothetical protein
VSELPISYRNQDGCHDCRHVFVKYEHDDPPFYFCTLNAPPRPLCCSVAMDETVPDDGTIDFVSFREANKRWEEWASVREVQAYGICDHHSPMDAAP